MKPFENFLEDEARPYSYGKAHFPDAFRFLNLAELKHAEVMDGIALTEAGELLASDFQCEDIQRRASAINNLRTLLMGDDKALAYKVELFTRYAGGPPPLEEMKEFAYRDVCEAALVASMPAR